MTNHRQELHEKCTLNYKFFSTKKLRTIAVILIYLVLFEHNLLIMDSNISIISFLRLVRNFYETKEFEL